MVADVGGAGGAPDGAGRTGFIKSPLRGNGQLRCFVGVLSVLLGVLSVVWR